MSTSAFQFIPVESHGTFNVTGGPQDVLLAFESRTSVATSFWLYFAESGLPSATPWNVTLGNATDTNTSTTGAIGFLVSNATYSFEAAATGFVATPSHGLVVANGPASVAAPIRIVFTPVVSSTTPTYTIRFTAAGLPATAVWRVSIGTANDSGTGGTLTLEEPNGSYTYAIAPVGGYVANSSGAVNVSGAPVLIVVDFHPFLSTVIFREVGLPAGAPWNVSLGTTPNASTTSLVEFSVPNGTYTFAVGGDGMAPSPGTGSVVVNGSGPTIVEIQFATPTTSASTVFGLTPLEAVAIAVFAAVLLVGVGTLGPTGRTRTPGPTRSPRRKLPRTDRPRPTTSAVRTSPEPRARAPRRRPSRRP